MDKTVGKVIYLVKVIFTFDLIFVCVNMPCLMGPLQWTVFLIFLNKQSDPESGVNQEIVLLPNVFIFCQVKATGVQELKNGQILTVN